VARPVAALPDLEQLPPPADLVRLGSVRLFAERAADAAPGFEVDAGNACSVAELCVRLDGMPLALELGAARVGLLSPEQILERLRETLGVLGPGSRAQLTRQRTLTATLDSSHELLGADERVLFRRLAVFAGSFGLAAAEQVGGREPLAPGVVLELLGHLVEKSLVSVERDGGPVRYRLLETVRQYAGERLDEAGERELLQGAHRAWYTGFAERHDPERAPDLMEDSPRLLDPEHDNLRAALRSSLARDPKTALRLAASIWRYWLVRGYYSEGRRWLDAALALAPAASELRARALMGVALLDRRRGEPAGQLVRVSSRSLKAIADEIVAIHDELGDELSLAQARRLAGMICWIDGHSEDADRLLSEALALAERLGAHHVIAATEHIRGIIALGCGEPLSAWLLGEILAGAGLPAGVFSLVSGPGEVVGEAIARHPAVDMVSFTGSVRAGKRVAELAARGVKRVTLELGGKSPNVVLDDADDLPAIVRGAIRSAFHNSGQTCSALTRLVVPRQQLPDVERLAAGIAAGQRVGDPTRDGTSLGPVVSQRQYRRVLGYINRGLREGARLVVGGPERPAGAGGGYFVAPTVFSDVRPDMTIAQEEIFGPVPAVIPYDSEEGPSRSPTAPPTASQPASGRATRSEPSGSPSACAAARSRSTVEHPTPPPRSAATSTPAWDASSA
jgi:hypothetical protein